MTKPATIPFHLCQVLEEEYESLQDEIKPECSWSFEPEHLNTASQDFIVQLLKNRSDPLAQNLRDGLLIFINDRRKDSSGNQDLSKLSVTEEELIAFLNSQLNRPDLYEEDRFKLLTLSDTTLKLIKLGWQSSPILRWRNPFNEQDLRHFNRLILEDVFPHDFGKIHEIRLEKIYGRIQRKKQAALCLSGGGMRSGTFSLGILQGLARHGLLDQFNYLSTVSGGGYIGSWLSAWIYRQRGDLGGVIEELKNQNPPSKLEPEQKSIHYLREYSHFLTPRYSLLSADVWTFVAIYLRNLVLNWLVLIPLLISVLTLPRLFLSLVTHPPLSADPSLLILLAILFAAFSIAYIGINRPSMGDALAQGRFWRKLTNQKYFLICCLATLSLSALLIAIAWAWMAKSGRAEGISSRWPQILRAESLLNPGALPIPLATFFTWIYPFRWYYLFAFASYAIGLIYSAITLGRIKKLGGVILYVLALTPVSAILLWVLTNHVFKDPQDAAWVGLYAVFAPPLYLLVWLLSITMVVGLVSRNYSHHRRIPGLRAHYLRDEDQEWYARLGGWMLIAMVIWMVLNWLVIFGPLVLLALPKTIALIGGGSGIFAALGGHSAKTPATQDKAAQQAASTKSLVSTVLSLVLPYILTIASLVFVMFLIAGLSLLTSVILHSAFSETPIVDSGIRATIHNASVGQILAVTISALVVAGIAAVFINLNKFSLHGSYATRLIRTYLGASRSRAEREPNPFTGFDPGDNIQMGELRPGLVQERSFLDLTGFVKELKAMLIQPPSFKSRLNSETLALLDNHDDTNPPSASLKQALITDLNGILENQYLYGVRATELPGATSNSATRPDVLKNRKALADSFSTFVKPYPPHAHKLFHVINMTLNLFHGDNLAWQQRKAESFTTSALHSGSFNLGYRETKNYGGPNGISLGTAATLSGAAVNSNMGSYFSSPLVSFVLTFFNARLGLWLGNPGIAGNNSYTQAYPRVPVVPIILEALGYTDDKSRFVNLSDGGHFENLAFYQMVLRRCNFIIVVDGGEDGECKFGDLGNAVRKVRIDLGIPIEFPCIPIYPRDDPDADKGTYWAVGCIKYSCVDGTPEEHDGLLLYIKPAFYGNEPSDIFNYARTHQTFPHQTTANQFFDESQFESYRMLGSYIMDKLCEGYRSRISIAALVENALAGSKTNKLSPEFEAWVKQWLNARSFGAGTS